jgi:hypothetical protein
MSEAPYTTLSVKKEERDKWERLAQEKGFDSVMEMIRFYMKLLETGRIE